MSIDHIGLFFDIEIFRIIGRLAFPIFAFLVAEGCYYTKNKALHLFNFVSFALLYQIIAFFFDDYNFSILFSYAFSVILIYLIQNIIDKKNRILNIILFSSLLVFLVILYSKIDNFNLSYGIFAFLFPLIIYIIKILKKEYLLLITIAVFIVIYSLIISKLNFFALLAIPFIYLYNGKLGNHKFKYFFYIYYIFQYLLINLLALVL